MGPHLPPCPPSSPTLRERKGGGTPAPSPQPPFLSHQGSGRGGDERRSGDPAPTSGNDAEATNQLTPLPQRGRGAGGEGGPHLSHAAGEGQGVRAALTFPPAPLPLPRCGRGRGGGQPSPGNPARNGCAGTVPSSMKRRGEAERMGVRLSLIPVLSSRTVDQRGV